ncbi:MFS transporter [Streptomyces sp. NPDC098789]|uniref:MFS transporter n=1 Tax=Streptomyces sp. NPDC098789 TaxID=3366098 RepID=UPI00380B17AB
MASVPGILIAHPSFGPLLLARAVQGGFGALVTSAALALVISGFPEPGERTAALGIYATTSVAGPVLGLLMATGAAWPTPLITTLLALAALAARRVLPSDRPDRTGGRFDPPCVLLGTFAIAGLVHGPLRAWTGRSETLSQLWGDPLVVAPLAGASSCSSRA